MTTERNKAHVRRLTEEVWNQGNFAVLDELVATDYVGHEPSMAIQGQEGVWQAIAEAAQQFITPDGSIRTENELILMVGQR